MMEFLRYFFLRTILFLCQITLALCVDDALLGHCQKSGCRNSLDGEPSGRVGGGGNNKYQVKLRPNDIAYIQQTRPRSAGAPKFHLLTLVIEWVLVFAVLRLVMFVKYNGWKPVRRRINGACSYLMSSPQKVRSWVNHEVSRGRYKNSRVSSGIRRSFVSRGSAASLGSLVDLIGDDGSTLGSNTVRTSSSDATSTSGYTSGYTSYYSESEYDVTSGATTVRKGYAKGLPLTDDESTVMSSLVSTSAIAASDASITALSPLSNKRQVKGASRQQRRANKKSRESDDDAGSESSESVLSKFIDFLSSGKKKEKYPRGGRGEYRRQSSLDESSLKLNTIERPLQYRGQNRRGSVDSSQITNDGDITTAKHAGMKLRYNPVSKYQRAKGNANSNTQKNNAATKNNHQGPSHWPSSNSSTQRIQNNNGDSSMMSGSMISSKQQTHPISNKSSGQLPVQESGQSSSEKLTLLETLLDRNSSSALKQQKTNHDVSGMVSVGLSVSDSMTEVNLHSVASNV